MDVVILAAGEGSRLNGITAPYMKPLLVVDRKPLIMHCLEQVRERGDGQVVIVCSPRNVGQIIDVIEANRWDPSFLRFVVQPRANGPAQALKLGLEVTCDGPVMVMCADNIMQKGLCRELFLREALLLHFNGVVCGKYVPASEASRYTYRGADEDSPWREHDDEVVPGPGPQFVWLGPLVIPNGDEFYAAIGDSPLIGPVLNAVRGWELVEADCHDVGVPEAIPS